MEVLLPMKFTNKWRQEDENIKRPGIKSKGGRKTKGKSSDGLSVDGGLGSLICVSFCMCDGGFYTKGFYLL